MDLNATASTIDADETVIINTANDEEQRKAAARARRIANLKPIKPGQALNPRGRPKKDLDLAALAQQHAQKAIETLAKCLIDSEATWPAKVSAASELLDRGFGRAPQSIDVKATVTLAAEFENFVRSIGRNSHEIIDVTPAE